MSCSTAFVEIQKHLQIIEQISGKEVQHRSMNTTPVRRVPEPLTRQMLPLLSPAESNGSRRFTVLSYNILAELYATQVAFPSSEPHVLLWQYRVQLILRELELYNADIICLQEVQSTSYHEDLLPAMDRLGFDAVFKKKTQVWTSMWQVFGLRFSDNVCRHLDAFLIAHGRFCN